METEELKRSASKNSMGVSPAPNPSENRRRARTRRSCIGSSMSPSRWRAGTSLKVSDRNIVRSSSSRSFACADSVRASRPRNSGRSSAAMKLNCSNSSLPGATSAKRSTMSRATWRPMSTKSSIRPTSSSTLRTYEFPARFSRVERPVLRGAEEQVLRHGHVDVVGAAVEGVHEVLDAQVREPCAERPARLQHAARELWERRRGPRSTATRAGRCRPPCPRGRAPRWRARSSTPRRRHRRRCSRSSPRGCRKGSSRPARPRSGAGPTARRRIRRSRRRASGGASGCRAGCRAACRRTGSSPDRRRRSGARSPPRGPREGPGRRPGAVRRRDA